MGWRKPTKLIVSVCRNRPTACTDHSSISPIWSTGLQSSESGGQGNVAEFTGKTFKVFYFSLWSSFLPKNRARTHMPHQSSPLLCLLYRSLTSIIYGTRTDWVDFHEVSLLVGKLGLDKRWTMIGSSKASPATVESLLHSCGCLFTFFNTWPTRGYVTVSPLSVDPRLGCNL